VPGNYPLPAPFANGLDGQSQAPYGYNNGDSLFGSQAQNPYGYNNQQPQSSQGYNNDSENRRRFFSGGNGSRFFRRIRD
jgi:hypothetical protein